MSYVESEQEVAAVVKDNAPRIVTDPSLPREHFRTLIKQLIELNKTEGNNNRILVTKVEEITAFVFNERSYYKHIFLGLPPDEAQPVLDILQKCLDHTSTGYGSLLRRPMLYLLLRLSYMSGLFPSSYFVDVVDDGVQIGRGGFAYIHRGTRVKEQDKVAIKRPFDTTDDTMDLYFREEAIVWYQLRHTNILRFIGIDRLYSNLRLTKDLALVSPLVENRTISTFVKSHVYKYNAHGEKLLRGIAEALSYLHSNNIVHGDITGNNILVNANMEPLLCDFGLAVVGQDTIGRPTTDKKGESTKWCSPERFKPDLFDDTATVSKASTRFIFRRLKAPADVYAYGLLCYLIITTREPFHDISDDKAMPFFIVNDQRRPKPDVTQSEASLFTRELMVNCWAHDPSDRPTMKIVAASFDRDSDRKLPLWLRGLVKVKEPVAIDDRLRISNGMILDIVNIDEENHQWVVCVPGDESDRLNIPMALIDPAMFPAKAKRSFATDDPRMLSLEANETVDILRISSTVWLGRKKSGEIASIKSPMQTLEISLDGENLQRARVLFSSDSTKKTWPFELTSYQKGDWLEVCHTWSEWCLARVPGEKSVFLARTGYLHLH